MENARVKKIKAFEFLCDSRLGVISTISLEEHAPEGSVIYYVVDKKDIYFITTKESRKIKNTHKNNKISLTVFTEIPPVVLQIDGTAREVTDSDQKSYISKIYLEISSKNPNALNWPPVLKLPNKEGFEFGKITVNWFKFSDFSNRESDIVEGTVQDWQ